LDAVYAFIDTYTDVDAYVAAEETRSYMAKLNRWAEETACVAAASAFMDTLSPEALQTVLHSYKD
jgi:hypothetical protein